jgi:hypothetical protein
LSDCKPEVDNPIPRYCGAFWIATGTGDLSATAPEKADQFAFRDAFHGRGLKNDPLRTVSGGAPDGFNLAPHARFRDCNRQRCATVQVFRDPFQQLVAFARS